jgi:hypothetical protein
MKRQRGRGRKPGSNNNRNFESNGPDVKIRGNAAHIYDKYMQLARDATSSGDRVMAENYYQHAEHYLRIVQTQQANQPKREEGEGDEGRGRRQDQGERSQGGATEGADAAQGEGDGRSRSRRGRGRRRDEDAPQPTAGDDPLQVVNPDAGEDAPAAEADAGDGEAEAPRRTRTRRRRPEAGEDGDAEGAAKPRRRTRRTPDPDAEAALQATEEDGGSAQSEDGAAA